MQAQKLTVWLLAGAGGVAIASGSLVFWVFLNLIAKPLLIASDAARQYAAGNVSQALDPTKAGELRILFKSMEAMRIDLSTLVGDLQSSCTSVNQAATQCRQSNELLSCNIESGALNLEQTATSIKLFSAGLHGNALDTKHAHALTQSTADAASKAATDSKKAMQAMHDLSASSIEINKVSKIIDELAAQTGMLALNASIEAARSGEAGRQPSGVRHERDRSTKRCYRRSDLRHCGSIQ